MLTGDYDFENFDKCNNIFDKFFLPFPTLNFGTGRDKIQNVLWCLSNITLQASVDRPLFTVAQITLVIKTH